PYGLAAMVWTTNLSRAHRVSAALRAGLVWVNCFFVRDLRTPFGGTKQSGVGREGGAHSREFFTEDKTVTSQLCADGRVDAHRHLVPTAVFSALPEGLEARDDGAEIALAVAARAGAVGRGAFAALRERETHRAQQAAHGVDLTIVGPWIDMV